MVSYRMEKGDRETRRQRQRCDLCRRYNCCRSQGFLAVDFSVLQRDKNNDLRGMDKRGEGCLGGKVARKKCIVLGGFFK